MTQEVEMPIRPQVLAAIGAALATYLADEEAARAAAMTQIPMPPPPPPPPSVWALAGRQVGMQMRLLIQRRMVK
jgi:hypothetical protein